MYCGQSAAYCVKITDGVHRKSEKLYDNAAHYNGNERGRHALFKHRVDNEYCKADKSDDHCPHVPCGEVIDKCLDLFKRLNRRFAVHIFYTEKVLELAEENGDGNARGKTGGNSIGNVLNKSAEAKYTHNNKDKTRHDGGKG